MVEGGHPDSVHIRCRCAASERSAPGGGEDTSTGSGRVPPAAGRTTRCVFRDGARQGAWASGQERGEPFPRPWRMTASSFPACRGWGVPVAESVLAPPGPIPNPVVTQRSAGEYCGGDPTGGEAAADTPHPPPGGAGSIGQTARTREDRSPRADS